MGNEQSGPGKSGRGFPTEVIGGVKVAAMDRAATARLMADAALASKATETPPLICTSVNGQVLAQVYTGKGHRTVADLIMRSDVVSVDGQPLVFASKLLGRGSVPERCATTDLFHDLARLAVADGLTFYMLGASAEENHLAVANARRLYPSLRIVGSRHGYFRSPEDEQAVVNEINALKPDVVWVSMGFPRELDFCLKWRDKLTGTGVMKTSGGLFNFLSGTRSRAPAWMQAAGLEWAYRMYLEPRRLFLRYATTNVIAVWLLLTKTSRRAG